MIASPLSPQITVSLLVDLPEPLHQSMRAYLESNPSMSQDDLIASAINLLLCTTKDHE